MTVGELIEELQKLDSNRMVICFTDHRTGPISFASPLMNTRPGFYKTSIKVKGEFGEFVLNKTEGFIEAVALIPDF